MGSEMCIRDSYEATDVESWSFVSSNEPVKNGCEVIYEINETYDHSLLDFISAVQCMRHFIHNFTKYCLIDKKPFFEF